MSLDTEQKKALLLQNGFDPEKFDIQEETPAESPEVKPAAAPTISPFKTGAQSVIRNLIPSLGMAGGMRLGAMVPPPFNLATIPAGGIAGNLLTSKLQESALKAIEGDTAYNTNLQAYEQSQEQNPKSALIGNILSTGPVFGPGNALKAGRGLSKLLVGAKPALAESQAAFNAGINAVIGGGVEGGRELLQGENVSPSKIGLSALGQGVLSEPTALGGKILGPKFTSTVASVRSPQPKGLITKKSSPLITPPPTKIEPPPLPTEAIATPEVLQEQLKKIRWEITQQPQTTAEVPKDAVVEQALKEPAKDTLTETPEVLATKAITKLSKNGLQPTARILQQEIGISPEQAEIVLQHLKDTGKIVKVSGNKDQWMWTADPKTFNQGIDSTVKPNLTEQDSAKTKQLAETRGVDVEFPEKITNAEGVEQRGYSVPEARVAGVSTTQGTVDTGFHEIGGHQFIEDLSKSRFQGDRVAAERGIKAAGNKELLADAIGKRIVDVNNKPLKSWLQDFWSNTKRLVRLGHDEDTVNGLARRARDDRPFSESPELWPENRIETIGKTPNAETLYSKTTTRPQGSTKEPSAAWFEAFKSPVEKLQSNPSYETQKAAKVARQFFEQERKYKGAIGDKIEQIMNKVQEPEKVGQWLHENRFSEGKPTVKLNPQDQAIVTGELRQALIDVHNEQRAIGRLVGGEREAKDNPYYSPTSISEKVAQTFSQGKDTVAIEKLRNDYIEHQLKYNRDIQKLPEGDRRGHAEEMLNSYLRNLGGGVTGSSPEFGAVNKAQGFGLPYSWTEKDPRRLFQRYTDKVARDFAFHNTVLKDPEAKIIYNYKDQFGKQEPNSKGLRPVNDPSLGVIYRAMTGQHGQGNSPTYKAVESAIRGGLLGTTTGAINHISGYKEMLHLMPTKDISHIVTSWKNLSKGMADSFSEGVNRRRTLDLEVKDIGPGYWADKIKELGNTLRKVQGANAIEQYTRGYHMAVGEGVAQSTWGRVRNGGSNVEDMRFLRKFGSDNFDYRNTPINDTEIKNIAARFVERVQGTYDARGVPAKLLEPTTPFYWLFNLSKWNVERANIIKQDVFNPLIKSGDFGPLLKYTLSSTLTGAAIYELKQLWNGKKNQTPNLTELADSGKISDWAHKFIELNSLASFGGIVGDGIKMAADKAKGYKVKDVGGIPALDVIQDTARNAVNALEAVNSGQDTMDVFFKFATDAVINNIQAARLISEQTVKKDQNAFKNKARDLNVYKHLNSKPLPPEADIQSNPYYKGDEKAFKRAATIDEAKKIMDEKINPRLKNLSKEDRAADIEGLKKNSYQTIPSDRKEQKEYLDFIRRTQEESSAATLLEDWKRQKQVNHQKNRLIPRR